MVLNTEKFKYIGIKNLNLLPPTTGVYCFLQDKKFLYIGKAINIKERIKNHIQQPTFKDNVFVPQTTKIGFIATGSELGALLLEANLIKKHKPQYNTVGRDGKSHNFVFITNEVFPRIFISHQTTDSKKKSFISVGPFIDGKSLKQSLRILRRVFPFRTCASLPRKPCLYFDLNLCSAPCKKECVNLCRSANFDTKKAYSQNIKNLRAILQGQKNSVIKNLQKEMQQASQNQNFEKAKYLRDQIFALENVFSHSHILSTEKTHSPKGIIGLQELLKIKGTIKRVEGYDISNIQGKSATGSMVVFENGKPNKNEYRKFKIKITGKPNDTAMIKEVLQRRLKHKEWPLPRVIFIDGGKAQLNAAIEAIYRGVLSVNLKVIALAKRNNELFIEGDNKPILLKDLPKEVANLILQIRDEAHFFAIIYHKNLRKKTFLN